MRTVSEEMTEKWLSQAKTGDSRPTGRATIQLVRLASWAYQGPTHTETGDKNVVQGYRTPLFSQPTDVLEIPNILGISWNRGVNQDVAECTITLSSNIMKPIGAKADDEYDDKGALIPTRGNVFDVNPWNFDENPWRDILMPDRLVRTYEGYGANWDVYPALDENLKQSGAWLIDDITFNADGNIEMRMRDVGRLMIDQIVYPATTGGGTVPPLRYPLSWQTQTTKKIDKYTPSGGKWYAPGGRVVTSNHFYVGKNIVTSDETTFVNSDGSWAGNLGKFALLSDLTKMWVSTGESERQYSKVWWECRFDNQSTAIAGLKIRNGMGRNVVFYISLEGPKGWIGRRKIPYRVSAEGVNLGSGIPFITGRVSYGDAETEIVFSKVYKDIKRVRITMAPNAYIGSDRYHPWRAALNTVKVYTGAPKKVAVNKTVGGQTITVGNYTDYTDIAKYITAWSAYYWPNHASGGDYMSVAPGVREDITFAERDPVLIQGRCWGDYMNAGTAGIADLTPDLFDKQPMWDVIGHVRDILGFVAFTDETGGFIWRMPNVWTIGNYLSPDDLDPRARTRTEEYLTITDQDVLLSYSTTLSSRNSREAIFVGNTDGKYATLVAGYAAEYGVDFRRVAGYMDQNFASQQEAEVMADLIATRQKFAARRSKVTIPGYPMIQIDDQIRIYEKTTNETYFHYVEQISSSLDMKGGTWTYEMTTHWLGEEEEDSWVVDRSSLTSEMNKYLIQIGVL